VWGSGQDATHTLARQMQLLLPFVQVWLDVDNLENIDILDKEVAKAVVLVVFASKGYFKSKNCRKELYAALHQKKPIVVILDTEKSGSLYDELREECREWCVDKALPEYPEFGGPVEALAAVFDREPPIVWSHTHDFQQACLKIVVTRILRHLPYYTAHPAELEAGVFVTIQVKSYSFTHPVRILTCISNRGAHRIANELAVAAARPGSAPVETVAAAPDHPLEELTTNGAMRRAQMVQLIYLNEETFAGEDGVETAAALRHILVAGIPFVLVHETNPLVGGCPFSSFIEAAPKDLQVAPYKLFGQIAVAMFPTPDFRSVSLQLLLRNMGATPVSSQWRLRLALPPWRMNSFTKARHVRTRGTEMENREQAAIESPMAV
jgi:hypothetical protein